MAVKSCPKCNEDNSAISSVCFNCGTSLKNCEVIGNTGEKNYSYFGKNDKTLTCPYCKEQLPANSSNCKYCGGFVSKTAKPVNLAAKSESRKYSVKSTMLLYLATLLIPFVGLIVGGVFTANDDTYKQRLGRSLLIFGLLMTVMFVLAGIILLGQKGLLG